MNRIGWLAPASFTDEQLPGNKIPEAEKKDYASRIRSFGASGKRTKEQQAAARAEARKLLAKLPESAIEVWTDGSRIGKTAPGPSGAGAIIKRKGAVTTELTWERAPTRRQSYGRLAARWRLCRIQARMVKRYTFLQTLSSQSTASQASILALSTTIVSQRLKSSRVLQIALSFLSPRGGRHAGIKDNDHADKLANEGSLYSKQNAIPGSG
jgi:hypothetical protein